MDAASISNRSVLFEILSFEQYIKWMRVALFKARESTNFAKHKMTIFSAHMQKLAAHKNNNRSPTVRCYPRRVNSAMPWKWIHSLYTCGLFIIFI